jgi:hypothetical protein
MGCDVGRQAAPTQEDLGMMPERSFRENIDFEILPGTGPGSVLNQGNTITLLLEMPYLFSSGFIPPESIINELLSSGSRDAGMSGGVQWAPYRLKLGEFDALVQELMSAYSHGSLVYQEPAAWVKSFEDWHVWVMFMRHGVPWEEHKRLNDAVVALEEAMAKARKDSDEARLNALHLEYIQAGTRLSEFMMEHLNK